MAGNKSDVAAAGAVDGHKRQDWKDAHNIWTNVKAYIDGQAGGTVWLAARVDLALGASTPYVAKDVSASVSARAKSIIINVVNIVDGGSGLYFSARPYGSAADPLIVKNFEIHDAAHNNLHSAQWGEMIEIPVSYAAKKFDYKLSLTGTWTFYLVGYREGANDGT